MSDGSVFKPNTQREESQHRVTRKMCGPRADLDLFVLEAHKNDLLVRNIRKEAFQNRSDKWILKDQILSDQIPSIPERLNPFDKDAATNILVTRHGIDPKLASLKLEKGMRHAKGLIGKIGSSYIVASESDPTKCWTINDYCCPCPEFSICAHVIAVGIYENSLLTILSSKRPHLPNRIQIQKTLPVKPGEKGNRRFSTKKSTPELQFRKYLKQMGLKNEPSSPNTLFSCVAKKIYRNSKSADRVQREIEDYLKENGSNNLDLIPSYFWAIHHLYQRSCVVVSMKKNSVVMYGEDTKLQRLYFVEDGQVISLLTLIDTLSFRAPDNIYFIRDETQTENFEPPEYSVNSPEDPLVDSPEDPRIKVTPIVGMEVSSEFDCVDGIKWYRGKVRNQNLMKELFFTYIRYLQCTR